MLKLVVLLAILGCVLLAPLPQNNKQLAEQQPQISSDEDSARPAIKRGLRFGDPGRADGPPRNSRSFGSFVPNYSWYGW